MRRWRLWLGVALAASVAGMGCHKSDATPVSLSVTPTTATVLLNNTVQFIPAVTGTTEVVDWTVNGVAGGDTANGTINANGLYSAPGTVPTNPKVTVTGTIHGTTTASSATVTIVSGVRVSISPSSFTIGTGETQSFVATVTGVPTNAVTSTCNSANPSSGLPLCTAVTWSLIGPGTVNATTGLYTAPATATGTSPVVTATSIFDTTQTSSAVITLVTATDPTLVSIGPNSGARGAVFQDIYLSGTNFISTTKVFINGVQVQDDGTAIQVSSVTCATIGTTTPPCTSASLTAGSTILRVRVSDQFLASALTLPSSNAVSLAFTVARQGGTPQSCSPDASLCQLILTPVSPVIVGKTPDSVAGGSGAPFSFNLNGGFYGTSPNPVVTGQFSGQPIFPTISSTNPARQLSVPVPPGAISQPGLYEVGVVSNTAGLAPALSNLAVQPQYLSSPSATATLGVGTKPTAVAINTATGIAVVANQTSNDVTLINLNTSAVLTSICTAAVGAPEPTCPAAGPTGVAVDNVRNMALVVNGTQNTVAVVDLQQQKVTSILNLATIVNNASLTQVPSAVGINPVTGRAILAYKGTNFGLLLDVTPYPNPPAVAGVVNLSTGANPRVAVSTKLNWALVTPGGLGTLAIVNLGQQFTNNIASAVNTGASRSTGSVTITTTSTHTLHVGDPVLVSGVADASFNGLFTVTSVPTGNTFRYTQATSLPNGSSGGGQVSYGIPISTVATSLTMTGIGFNDQTSKVLLADPGSNGVPVSIFNALDQTSISLSGTLPLVGTIGAAFNPLTNIGVIVNQTDNTGYVIDPTTPTFLTSFPVGTNPFDVAIDPGSNTAVVVNQGDNSVSLVPLGAIRTPQILDVSPAQVFVNSTLTSVAAPANQTLTIVGKGFTGASRVRLDGVEFIPASTSDRVITVTVPAAMQAVPHRYAVDVVNSGTVSNAAAFTVIQSINLSGCAAPAPTGVAIDAPNNLALVTDSGCNSLYAVHLDSGLGQAISVGTNPLGVAVVPQGGLAVVANTGSNNISLVDDLLGNVKATISTETNPSGVAIDPVLGQIVVTATGSNNINVLPLNSTSSSTFTSTPVLQGPVPLAIDPVRHIAAVGNQAGNSVSLVSLTSSSSARTLSVFLPSAIVYDPVSTNFIVSSSLANQISLVNPVTQQVFPVRVGINPTSMAYNFASSTLVTANSIGQTMTVVDMVDLRVRAVFPLSSSGQFSVDIHPKTNLVVVADAPHQRILLVPLP